MEVGRYPEAVIHAARDSDQRQRSRVGRGPRPRTRGCTAIGHALALIQPPTRPEPDVNAPVPDVSTLPLDDLLAEHRRLDARLRELESQRSLTAVEQVEYGTLKKQKLLAKDRIVRLQAADRRS